MTDEISDMAAQIWGEDDEWMAPGSHGGPADDARKAAACAYAKAAILHKSCEAILRAEPDNDAQIDAIEIEATKAWIDAMAALNRFRAIRECSGQC